MMQTGKVWLAGAGPGSVELLTVKAWKLIKAGDCIVYDRLVGNEILSMIPADTELINVGKSSGHHAIPQTEINQILIREAKLGKKVIRLKGGDPFLFGRGGEEIEALRREGIPFEVVPGVSSCAAVPAYNGIPVTHRDYVSSVHIITGHRRAGTSDEIDYGALAFILLQDTDEKEYTGRQTMRPLCGRKGRWYFSWACRRWKRSWRILCSRG